MTRVAELGEERVDTLDHGVPAAMLEVVPENRRALCPARETEMSEVERQPIRLEDVLLRIVGATEQELHRAAVVVTADHILN